MKKAVLVFRMRVKEGRAVYINVTVELEEGEELSWSEHIDPAQKSLSAASTGNHLVIHEVIGPFLR